MLTRWGRPTKRVSLPAPPPNQQRPVRKSGPCTGAEPPGPSAPTAGKRETPRATSGPDPQPPCRASGDDKHLRTPGTPSTQAGRPRASSRPRSAQAAIRTPGPRGRPPASGGAVTVCPQLYDGGPTGLSGQGKPQGTKAALPHRGTHRQRAPFTEGQRRLRPN